MRRGARRHAAVGVRKVAALGNASDPFMPLFLEKVHPSGKAVGIEIAPVTVHSANEIEAAFATILKDGAGALVMQGSLPSRTVAELALKQACRPGLSRARSPRSAASCLTVPMRPTRSSAASIS
jgi:hypothetical protein